MEDVIKKRFLEARLKELREKVEYIPWMIWQNVLMISMVFRQAE